MKTLIKRTLITFAVVTGVVAFEVIAEGWHAFGASAQGTRLERLQKSPQWRDGKFENPQPLINHVTGTLVGLWHASKFGRPSEPLVPQPVNPEMFLKPPSSGLRITWLGHGTSLIELDGTRVLTDPVWSERPSPVSWAARPVGIRLPFHSRSCRRSMRCSFRTTTTTISTWRPSKRSTRKASRFECRWA